MRSPQHSMQTPNPGPESLRAPLLSPVSVLVLAIGLTWAASLDASFQFDDWNVIVGDLRVQTLAAWWHSLPGIRPVLKLSYAAGNALGGSPRVFRLFNIGVHALNAALLFGLLHRRARLQPALLTALAAAMIFALEPVQTEAVTYLSGRSSCLVALPCLVSLWCWDLAFERPSGTALHVLGILCYAIAVGIKETALVLPAILWIWHATKPGGTRPSYRIAFAYTLAAAAMLVAALTSGTYRQLLATSLQARSIPTNLLIQAQACGYLVLDLLRLSALNADPQMAAVAPAHGIVAVLCGLAWLSVPTLAWINRHRAPEAAFGVLWFFVWLLPTNSVLPRLDVANDRQLYLALVGPAWIVAQLLRHLYAHSSVCAWSLLALLAAILGTASAQRNLVYETEITFWQDISRQSPGNARAANNLGIAFAVACRDEDASREFRRAIALEPDGFRARINLQLLDSHELTRRDSGGCPLLMR
jgi:protein O-mannosyl-transferase